MTASRSLFLTLLALAATGCAFRGSGPEYNEQVYAFPDAPGIVYLTSFGSKDDLKPPSAFRRWIIGRDAADDNLTIVKPYGIAAGKGRIYINDGLGSAGYWVLPLDTKELHLVRHQLLSGSTGIALDERGRKYFAVPRLIDAKARGTLGTAQEKGRIVVFGADDQLLRWVDFPGRPIGIAVSGGLLFVTDIVSHRVAVLDRESLAVLRSFGERGRGEKEFDFPKPITADGHGHVYVGDMMNGRIKVFDTQGRFVSQYGYRSDLLGSFLSISGLAADGKGLIYAVDSSAQRKLKHDEVQIFRAEQFYPDGEPVPPIDTKLEDRRNALVGFFQKPGAVIDPAYSLYRPIDLTIDTQNGAYFQHLLPGGEKIDYLIWLTSQSAANGRNVSVFAQTLPE